MQHDDLDTEPWYRQFWPWALIALPLATVLACTATILIAIHTDDGLVSDDYYKEGLSINRRMREDREANTQ